MKSKISLKLFRVEMYLLLILFNLHQEKEKKSLSQNLHLIKFIILTLLKKHFKVQLKFYLSK
jgi:hypothetical protein